MGRRYVRSVVDLEQDFFLVIDRRRRENLIAGQMAVICPHRRADRLQRCHCIAVFIHRRHRRKDFNFLVFQFQGSSLPHIAPVNSL